MKRQEALFFAIKFTLAPAQMISYMNERKVCSVIRWTSQSRVLLIVCCLSQIWMLDKNQDIKKRWIELNSRTVALVGDGGTPQTNINFLSFCQFSSRIYLLKMTSKQNLIRFGNFHVLFKNLTTPYFMGSKMTTFKGTGPVWMTPFSMEHNSARVIHPCIVCWVPAKSLVFAA